MLRSKLYRVVDYKIKHFDCERDFPKKSMRFIIEHFQSVENSIIKHFFGVTSVSNLLIGQNVLYWNFLRVENVFQ